MKHFTPTTRPVLGPVILHVLVSYLMVELNYLQYPPGQSMLEQLASRGTGQWYEDS